ncbi:MAG: hypothetical protein IKD44_03785 [Lentisphaeria bacterium]|nr:hypothetical protein [Lentisphaeria bacterium]
MRKLLLLFAAGASLLLSGANMIPNGEFKDPKGYKPHIRIPGKDAKSSWKGNFLLTETASPKGVVEINCHRIPEVIPGKRLFMRMNFEVTAFDASFTNEYNARVIFWDKQGKQVPKKYVFTPRFKINSTGVYDLFHTFKVPAGAARCTLSFWLRGVKQAQVRSLILSEKFPVNNPDGNLMLNGSLESASMSDFYFRGTSRPPVTLVERSTAKAKDGRYSLRSFCSDPKKGTEINFNSFPFTPGKQYSFSMEYFITSAAPKNRIAGRVTFMNEKGKAIRHMFPEWKNTPGEWHKAKLAFFPPANCVRITVTLWIIGKQEVFFDNFYYGIAQPKTLANRNEGASLISTSADCTIWKEAPYLKVPYEKVPAGLKKASVVSISAAANESEPFQIAVNANKDLDNVFLKFADLKGAKGVIPAAGITSNAVGFIYLKNPDNPAIKGYNADPILPENSAKALKGKNQPFYVLVRVPAGTAPGIYTGPVKVMSGSKELGSFTLSVRVYNFALPEIAHLKTYFYAQPGRDYVSIDKRPRAEIIKNFHQLLLDHRMNGNQALTPVFPVFKVENGKLTVTDWSGFDKDIELRHKVYKQINFPVPYLGMMGDNWGWFNKKDRSRPRKSPFGNFNWLSPEGLKYAGQYAALFTAHVKKKFPGLNFYAYIYDEPPARVHKDLKVILDSVHKAAPDLKVFIPKEVIKDIGYTHTFCVPLSPGRYKPLIHDEHYRNGGDIWYYNWTVRISDHNYHLSRFFAWRIYAAKGNGGLLWNTVYFPKGVNPWTDLDKTHLTGTATIFLPPRKKGEGNIPTLRSALVKESIDDFDYMRILEQLIETRYPGMGRQRVLELMKEVMPTLPFGECNDPHLIYAVRGKFAEEIEKFKSFPAVAVSSPSANSSTETAPVEFKICAPAGTQIKINGKAVPQTASPKGVKVRHILSKLGVNSVRIELTSQGRTCTLTRNFELKADPRLKELAELLVKCEKSGIKTAEPAAFLKKVNSGAPYTAKERALTGRYLETYKRALAESAFKGSRTFASELERFFFNRAKETFGFKLFERTEYYLSLANEVARAGNMKNFKVKVTPTTVKDHPALVLDNGIIRAVIMEAGATLVSFKVKGVETLVCGDFRKPMSAEKRAAQHATSAMLYNLGGYEGYGDAGAGGLWPISYVDWNIAVKELRSEKASFEFSIKLPKTPFIFKRTMTMEAGSPDLKAAYEIVNTMPVDAASDDPEHFQLPWRGRLMPAIGSGALPQQDDTLVVPAKFADEKLAESHFNTAKPASYERRSIRIAKPYLGAFDTKLQKGIAVIGDKVITHAYIWFNSKGDHNGKYKVYTLEFPRSFYGKKHNDREPNMPLTIEPGKTLNFTIIFRGLEKVTSSEDLIRQAGF